MLCFKYKLMFENKINKKKYIGHKPKRPTWPLKPTRLKSLSYLSSRITLDCGSKRALMKVTWESWIRKKDTNLWGAAAWQHTERMQQVQKNKERKEKSGAACEEEKKEKERRSGAACEEEKKEKERREVCGMWRKRRKKKKEKERGGRGLEFFFLFFLTSIYFSSFLLVISWPWLSRLLAWDKGESKFVR